MSLGAWYPAKSKGGNSLVYQAQITDASQVHSISDLRFEVTSISDGVYKELIMPQAPSFTDQLVGLVRNSSQSTA
jgi:hypothetical protein